MGPRQDAGEDSYQDGDKLALATSFNGARQDAGEDTKITSDKHMTIYVNEVVKKAVGGAIRRLASGGRLAGFGGGDRIPALLEAGEYVIRKEAVAMFGEGIFHALNNLRYPPLPRFASGGPVAAGGGGSTVNINLTIGQDGPYPMQTDPMTADRLMRDLARKRRLRSA